MATPNRKDVILIVDDDREIRTLLAGYLDRNGFDVLLAADGKEMMRILAQQAVDLAVLDLMLPGEDGLSLCRKVRSGVIENIESLPVIMLTALGEEADRIVGIEMGADDYLVKPFNPRELVARIRAILRRVRVLPANLRAPNTRYFIFSGWRLDTVTRSLTSPDHVRIALSGAEYRLLSIFLEYPNCVVSRDQIAEILYGREMDALDRSLDVQVSRLRQRLRLQSAEHGLIQTVRGQGYVLASTVECAD